jgi:hypothetical protein
MGVFFRRYGKGDCHQKKDLGSYDMKEEYDFSKAERGKFYRPNVTLNIPIYLEPETLVPCNTYKFG